KLIALTILTFIALIVVGASYSGHGGDTIGSTTGKASDVIASQGLNGDSVPPSQVGINALANEAGHLHVAVNFTWLLMTVYLVLFMETAGYIIIGAIAERISFAGFILAELAMGAIIYPIYGNWLWGGGWLAHLGSSIHWGHGSVDFAGSGVVHATGGWTALALAMILGPRIGKFNKDGTPNAIPGHNIGYVVIGTMVL